VLGDTFTDTPCVPRQNKRRISSFHQRISFWSVAHVLLSLSPPKWMAMNDIRSRSLKKFVSSSWLMNWWAQHD
jgi:hypothetical protein